MTERRDDIRRVQRGEARALSDLAFRSKAHWGYDAAFMHACKAELRVTPADIASACLFVYDEDGRALAFYRLDMEDPAADIGLFFVEPEALGRGVGRAMWRHLVEQARASGATKITIVSDPNAEGFYRRMGAERVGTAPSVSIRGRDLPYLEFDLDVTRTD